MAKYRNYVHLFFLLVIIAGCSDTQLPEEANGPIPTAQDPESTDHTAEESTLLTQEMVQVAVEMMKAQNPSIDPNEVSRKLQEASIEIRKHYPEFLIVSAEMEQRLKASAPVPESAQRIARAEMFLSEFQIQASGLVQILLPQHKAGTLSPVRTELLAQLMTADMKKAEAALAN